MLQEFPTEFPQESLTILLDAWQGNLPSTHQGVKVVWNVAGYGAGKAFPHPVSGMSASAQPFAANEPTLEEGTAALQQAIQMSTGEGMHAITIPPALMAVIIQVAMALLQRWLTPKPA